MKQLTTIGRKDRIDLPDFNIHDIKAKIDTGAYTSSIHCSHVKKTDKGLEFTLRQEIDGHVKSKSFLSENYKKKQIKSSNGVAEERYIIKTHISLFGKTYLAEFSLTDRSRMKNPVLIGRKFLKGRFIVDVSKKDLSYLHKSNTP